MPGLPGPEAGEAGGGEEGLCLPRGKVRAEMIREPALLCKLIANTDSPISLFFAQVGAKILQHILQLSVNKSI